MNDSRQGNLAAGRRRRDLPFLRPVASLVIICFLGLALFLGACGPTDVAGSASAPDPATAEEYLGWVDDAISQVRAARQILEALLDVPRQDADWRARLGDAVERWRQVYDDANTRPIPPAFVRGQSLMVQGLESYVRGGDQIEQGIDVGDNRLLARGLGDLDYGDKLLDTARVTAEQEASK